ncbi:hypothetical protein LTR56_014244 [Elasticomyces elasticus]|nr:hypothetical protein LTR22_026465 [Elasticomyces elasticus]KAK3636288.1 hypothetical protein LTR56_014244 [Elasticomyces elasticus]KAK4930550.1 hypothetical protein LTR49_002962 [Elasticomyces elasticus]KAK5748263.1 hypothetical protein LTS12_021664 [Elasticomyces elasticus]
MEQSPFNLIPSELRNTIYELVLAQSPARGIVVHFHKSTGEVTKARITRPASEEQSHAIRLRARAIATTCLPGTVIHSPVLTQTYGSTTQGHPRAALTRVCAQFRAESLGLLFGSDFVVFRTLHLADIAQYIGLPALSALGTPREDTEYTSAARSERHSDSFVGTIMEVGEMCIETEADQGIDNRRLVRDDATGVTWQESVKEWVLRMRASNLGATCVTIDGGVVEFDAIDQEFAAAAYDSVHDIAEWLRGVGIRVQLRFGTAASPAAYTLPLESKDDALHHFKSTPLPVEKVYYGCIRGQDYTLRWVTNPDGAWQAL